MIMLNQFVNYNNKLFNQSLQDLILNLYLKIMLNFISKNYKIKLNNMIIISIRLYVLVFKIKEMILLYFIKQLKRIVEIKMES